MQSRILYIAPSGPLCFIDYLTVAEGRAVLEKLRNTMDFSRFTQMVYEFRLVRMMKDKIVGIDRLMLPRFDRKLIEIFLDSCCRTPTL
ncbi:hypothetical protein [Chitinophaga caseinilytica]|uniref:hypothetical protein n=1 Tax=Chitinophaga caseinilytica TaxID=2267521 RepID=UPI003C2E54C5